VTHAIFPALLAPDEPEPVEVVNPGGSSRLLILCDHGGRRVPARLHGLGLPADALDRHIAWDIGAKDIGLFLAERFDALAVIGVYSRLVVDLNRYAWDPALMPEASDGIPIPGNQALSMPDRERRMAEIYRPYHARIAGEIEAMAAAGRPPIVLSVHSMTERMATGGFRPQEITVCWAEDERLSRPALTLLAEPGDVTVGDNQPYALDIGIDYTVPEHAMRRGLPALQIEFRQDLVGTPAGARAWAARFADVLERLLAEGQVS